MTIDARVSALIKQIYTAGEDPKAWDEISVRLLQIMGCQAGIATLVRLPGMQLLSCRVYAPRAAEIDESEGGYPDHYAEDPCLVWASINPHARFCDSREILSANGNFDHPFARWTRRRLHAAHWYTGFSASDDGPTFFLSAFFGEESGEELDDAHQVFRTIFDHMDCALRLGRQPSVELSARALIRLGSDGSVQTLSKGAQNLLGQRGPLRITDGRLAALCPKEQLQLDHALSRASAFHASTSGPTAVHVGNDQGRPWITVVRPVYECFGPFGKVNQQVQVEVFDRVPTIGRLDIVQSLFNLTGRELQVLRLLSEGHSIDSSSACLNVSRNTTRAHLRAIYTKTRTSSQAELMQLCAGLSAAASADVEPARGTSPTVN